MLNSDLPNINNIGPGSEVRAAVAKWIGYIEAHCGGADKAAAAAFLVAAATRLGHKSGAQ